MVSAMTLSLIFDSFQVLIDTISLSLLPPPSHIIYALSAEDVLCKRLVDMRGGMMDLRKQALQDQNHLNIDHQNQVNMLDTCTCMYASDVLECSCEMC